MASKALACLFVVLLCSCNSKQDKWNALKKTKSVYPADTIYSFKDVVLQDSQPTWVNVAYTNYAYKDFCTGRVQAEFFLTDIRVQISLHEDSLKIARQMLDSLRQNGVAHFVGQKIIDNKLMVYYYTDGNCNPIWVVSNFGIPCNGEFVDDERWLFYLQLLGKVPAVYFH